MRPAAISRRAVLGAALAGSLSGCGVRWVASPETTPTVQPGPDDDARDAAVADARAVAALAVVPPGSAAGVAAAVTAVATATAAHRRALGDDPAATPAPAAPAASAPVPADVAALVALLARTAAGGLTAVAPLGAGTARLLVSVAVARAVLLDGLAAAAGVPAPDVAAPETTAPETTTSGTTTSGTTTSGTTTSTASATAAPTRPPAAALAALQRALAGEHGAVYAYGLVSGRAAVERRGEALADLAAHRVARDRLVDALRALGADPVAAAAAYEASAATPADAAALAAAVEERLAAIYEDVVGADRTRRGLGAAAVLRAARAGVRWGSPVRSFPGLPALADDGGPTAPATGAASATGASPLPAGTG